MMWEWAYDYPKPIYVRKVSLIPRLDHNKVHGQTLRRLLNRQRCYMLFQSPLPATPEAAGGMIATARGVPPILRLKIPDS